MPTAAVIDVGLPSWKRAVGDKRPGLGLLCPDCAGDTGVIDSRPGNNNSIRRRRCCFACEKRFTTWEIIAAANPETEARELRRQARALRATADQLEKLAALCEELAEVTPEMIEAGSRAETKLLTRARWATEAARLTVI